FFQAEDGIRDGHVTGVQTCALPISRFLGDLYQNLSESARKRYALCQTPSFVIDFILDRTLTPALDAFGLEATRMIDPSCGSGHFVLAAFARIFRLWQGKEPGTNPPAL